MKLEFTSDEITTLGDSLIAACAREERILSLFNGRDDDAAILCASCSRRRIDDYNALLARLRSAPDSM